MLMCQYTDLRSGRNTAYIICKCYGLNADVAMRYATNERMPIAYLQSLHFCFTRTAVSLCVFHG